jgi:hypothetical protein
MPGETVDVPILRRRHQHHPLQRRSPLGSSRLQFLLALETSQMKDHLKRSLQRGQRLEETRVRQTFHFRYRLQKRLSNHSTRTSLNSWAKRTHRRLSMPCDETMYLTTKYWLQLPMSAKFHY